MTPEQRFLSEGAESFGNRLIYRHKDVGFYEGGALTLTPTGQAELQRLESITDVEVKVPKARARKATESAVPADVPAAPAE